MRLTRAAFGLLLLCLISACVTGPIDCELHIVAQTPIEMNSRLMTVQVGIKGVWTTLLVDTGAERTILSEEATARLGLARDPRRLTRSSGMGGVYEAHDAIIPGLVIGGKRFPLEHVAVGQLRFGQGLTADGLLGSDVLLGYDLDIDVPKRTLSLYRARRCPDVEPPWKEPSARVPGVRAFKDRLLIPVEVDGAIGMGILDTGAQATTLGGKMAVRLGLTAADMAADPIVRHHGAGPGTQESRLHQFSYLKIGPVRATRPLLSVLPIDIGAGDALVGQDFINGRRIWMSFTSREVFIATTRPDLPAVGNAP